MVDYIVIFSLITWADLLRIIRTRSIAPSIAWGTYSSTKYTQSARSKLIFAQSIMYEHSTLYITRKNCSLLMKYISTNSTKMINVSTASKNYRCNINSGQESRLWLGNKRSFSNKLILGTCVRRKLGPTDRCGDGAIMWSTLFYELHWNLIEVMWTLAGLQTGSSCDGNLEFLSFQRGWSLLNVCQRLVWILRRFTIVSDLFISGIGV